jgi:uncharacterized protein (TIRG00374 family)
MRKWVAGLGILFSLVFVLIILSRVDVSGAMENVRALGWNNWVIGVAIYLCAFLPRGWRWKRMLPHPGRLPSAWLTKAVVVGFAANNILPLRLGEVVRSFLAGNRFNIPKMTCLASIVAEKILDGLCLLAFLALCLPFIELKVEFAARFQKMFLLASALFGLAIAGCFAAAFCHESVGRLVEKRLPPRLALWVKSGLNAAKIFKDWRSFVAIIALTILIWMLEAACFVFFSSRLGVTHPLPKGIFCLVVVNLSILIPSAPGYIGIFQAGAVASFLAMGMEASRGLALGAVTHAAQWVPTTLLGLLIASSMGLNWRQLYHLKNE